MQKELIFKFLKNIKPDLTEEKLNNLYTEYHLENEEEIIYSMQELLQAIGVAFSTDWKWETSDVLGWIKNVVPGFEYEILKDTLDDNSNKFEIELIANNNQKVKYSSKHDDLDGLIKKINEVIKKLVDAEFKSFDTGGDSFFYLLVPCRYNLSKEEKKLIEFS